MTKAYLFMIQIICLNEIYKNTNNEQMQKIINIKCQFKDTVSEMLPEIRRFFTISLYNNS